MALMKTSGHSDKFQIIGLDGKRDLKGEIFISGAKNAVLKIMVASVLFKDDLIIENTPEVEDVFRMKELLENLGAKVEVLRDKKKVIINTSKIINSDMDKQISERMRASVVLTGPLLARFGKVSFPHPGGCVIGERPIGMFLRTYEGMGAKVIREKNGLYKITAENGLVGKKTFFSKQSVGVTETLMMTAVLAKGKTTLKNCAMEPEIVSLGEFLVLCGAKIEGLGTTTIKISGGEMLWAKGKRYKVIPDRLETGSYLILGALTSNNLLIKNCNPEHLEIVTSSLRYAGVQMEVGYDYIKILDNKNLKLKPLDIKTHEYPGFPTDLQAPMTVALTQAIGVSSLFEVIFENRLGYIEDLNKMGAKIKLWHPQKISITGPTKLQGAKLLGPDLRAGLAFIIAGIIAKGGSIIENAYYIDRGYEKIEEKLSGIGVNIKRIK